jgi:hypothetical protein
MTSFIYGVYTQVTMLKEQKNSHQLTAVQKQENLAQVLLFGHLIDQAFLLSHLTAVCEVADPESQSQKTNKKNVKLADAAAKVLVGVDKWMHGIKVEAKPAGDFQGFEADREKLAKMGARTLREVLGKSGSLGLQTGTLDFQIYLLQCKGLELVVSAIEAVNQNYYLLYDLANYNFGFHMHTRTPTHSNYPIRGTLAQYCDAPYALLAICEQLQQRVDHMKGLPSLKLPYVPDTVKKPNKPPAAGDDGGQGGGSHGGDQNGGQGGGQGGQGGAVLQAVYALERGTLDFRHEGTNATVYFATRRRDGIQAAVKIFTSREFFEHELRMVTLAYGEGECPYITPVLDTFGSPDYAIVFPRWPTRIPDPYS